MEATPHQTCDGLVGSSRDIIHGILRADRDFSAHLVDYEGVDVFPPQILPLRFIHANA